jgi:hypothetical protein
MFNLDQDRKHHDWCQERGAKRPMNEAEKAQVPANAAEFTVSILDNARARAVGRFVAAASYVIVWVVQLRAATRFGAVLPNPLPSQHIIQLISAALYAELLKLVFYAVTTHPARWFRDTRVPVDTALAAVGYGTCTAAATLLAPLSLSAMPALALRAGMAARLPVGMAMAAAALAAQGELWSATTGLRRTTFLACLACSAAAVFAVAAAGTSRAALILLLQLASTSAATALSTAPFTLLTSLHFEQPRAAGLASSATSVTLLLHLLLGALAMRDGAALRLTDEAAPHFLWMAEATFFVLTTAAAGCLSKPLLRFAGGAVRPTRLAAAELLLVAVLHAFSCIDTAPDVPRFERKSASAALLALGLFAALAGYALADADDQKIDDQSSMQPGHQTVVEFGLRMPMHANADVQQPASLCSHIAAAVLAVAVATALPLLLRRHARAFPSRLHVSNYASDFNASHGSCMLVPSMYDLSIAGTHPVCPENPKYYSVLPAPEGSNGALLRTSCISELGGVASYTITPVARISKKDVSELRDVTPTPFPSSGEVLLPRNVLDVRVTCRLPHGGGVLDEFTLVAPNMVADMDERFASNAARAAEIQAEERAASAAPDEVQSVELPTNGTTQPRHVLVFLMDALSRAVAAHVMRDVIRMFREQSLHSTLALEFDHFSVVDYNSIPNWGAMFCGDATGAACLADRFPAYSSMRGGME